MAFCLLTTLSVVTVTRLPTQRPAAGPDPGPMEPQGVADPPVPQSRQALSSSWRQQARRLRRSWALPRSSILVCAEEQGHREHEDSSRWSPGKESSHPARIRNDITLAPPDDLKLSTLHLVLLQGEAIRGPGAKDLDPPWHHGPLPEALSETSTPSGPLAGHDTKLKLDTKCHTVPSSWTGLQPYSKPQQSQQPLDPPSVAAEKHPATETHAPSFLGRRTEAQGTPIVAIPRLHGHRTHQKIG